jgi:hypothetical protein
LEAATAEQTRTPGAKTISRAEVYALIDYHGDVGAALKREDPAELTHRVLGAPGGAATTLLEVGVDSAKDDADAIAGRETPTEALMPWRADVLTPRRRSWRRGVRICRSGLLDSLPPRHLGERGLQVAA